MKQIVIFKEIIVHEEEDEESLALSFQLRFMLDANCYLLSSFNLCNLHNNRIHGHLLSSLFNLKLQDFARDYEEKVEKLNNILFGKYIYLEYYIEDKMNLINVFKTDNKFKVIV